MTGKEIFHIVGSATPQNNRNGSVKLTLPPLPISLELLPEDESWGWAWYHTEVSLPGVASSDSHDSDESDDAAVPLPVLATVKYAWPMWEAYTDGEGEVERTADNNGTTTIPTAYTGCGKREGHERINFERDDTLKFFAPESLLKHAVEDVDVDEDEDEDEDEEEEEADKDADVKFKHLFVCTEDELDHLIQEHTTVHWGGPHPRPSHSPAEHEEFFEVSIHHGEGEEPEHTTRPVSEGWVPLVELYETEDRPAGGPDEGPGGATGSSAEA